MHLYSKSINTKVRHWSFIDWSGETTENHSLRSRLIPKHNRDEEIRLRMIYTQTKAHDIFPARRINIRHLAPLYSRHIMIILIIRSCAGNAVLIITLKTVIVMSSENRFYYLFFGYSTEQICSVHFSLITLQRQNTAYIFFARD